MKKYIPFLGLIAALVFSFPSNSFADMAPNPPSCAESMDYSQSPAVPLKPTCGYFSLTSMLDASSYADKFVFLKTESCNETTYSMTDPVFKDTSGRFSSVDVIAVDKDYFQANGGIQGIFVNKSIPSDDECDDATNGTTVTTMAPKNDSDFKNHSYAFVVSKNDPNLYIDSSNLISGKYSSYYNLRGDDYKPTTDMSCTADTCSEMVVYVPQKVDGNYIVVAQSKINYTPAQLANYPAYVDKGVQQPTPTASSTSGTKPSITPTPSQQQNLVVPPNPEVTTSTPPASTPHISWIHRVWNSIINFFKNLFK